MAKKVGVQSPFWEMPGTSSFFVGAFTVFGGGMLYGVHRVLKKEQFKLNLKMHRTPFAVASKALLWGTALCFGTFSAGTAVFISASGISSFREFQDSGTKYLAQFDSLATKDEAVLKDLANMKKLSVNEELDLWDKFFTLPRDDDKVEEDISSSESNQKLPPISSPSSPVPPSNSI